jgi:hypothetical protein
LYKGTQNIALLNTAMTVGSALDGGTVEIGSAFTSSLSFAYNGDVAEYPIVTVYGPLGSVSVTNETTGEVLSFGTHTLGSGNYWQIDTRYGYKTVVDSGGTSQLAKLDSDSDLATFHIAAAPDATGGTNVITLAGTGVVVGTPTLAVSYRNRYLSF